MKRAIVALLLGLTTACGSTVQLSAHQQLGQNGSISPDGQPTTSVSGASSAPSSAVGPAAEAPRSSTSLPSGTGSAGSGGANAITPGTQTTVSGSHAPVEVGFFVYKDLGPATKALGVNGLATGNGPRQAQAAVALLNSRGGLAGHRVIPVIFEYDVTGNQNSQYQSACSKWFDDYKVRAVVSALLLPTLRECATKKGVPFVTSGNRTTSAAEINRYPLTALPPQISLERLVSPWIASLITQGYFGTSAKIGLIYNEDLDYAGVPKLVQQALKDNGLSLADQRSMPGVDDTSRVTAASSAGQNAVLKFKAEGINRVLALDKSGQALAYFGIAAANQGYYPTYGISSLELPAILRTVLTAKQLEGTRGVGWSPGVDVPVGAQPALGSNYAACLKAMRDAGEDMTASATRFSALSTCDGILLLAAAWTDQSLSPSTFLSGLHALGQRYSPVLTFAHDFSRHVDGAASFRALAYGAGCDCFAYSGPLQTAS